MPAILDTTGLQIPTLDELASDIKADLLANVSQGLNLEADSPWGEVVLAVARQQRKAYELFQAAYAAGDIDQATGASLGYITKLTGTPRAGATYSTVLCNCTLAAGTYAIGTLVANVAGDSTRQFANTVAVTSPGGLVPGIAFAALATGPVRANAGTLTTISGAVTGWTTVTNPLDATLGTLAEADTTLRIRQADELAQAGSNTVDAIRANLYEVAGVTFADVLENVTDSTDANGLPPHSLNAIVLGGTNQAVATQLFNQKPGGIQTYASLTSQIVATVTDAKNQAHTVYFNRPTITAVYLDLTIQADADTYGGDALVKSSLVDFGDSTYGVGDDVILSKLVATVFANVPGILDITTIKAGFLPAPSGTVNLVLGPREIADLDTSQITLTVTLV